MPLIEQDVIGDSFASLLKANGDIDTLAWSIEYTKRLEENGRDQLHIWPEHCIIGTQWHAFEMHCINGVIRQGGV